MKSIVQKERECWFCGTQLNLHKHHIIYGSGKRKLSEKYGLTVYLCAGHHNMTDQSVHHSKPMDLALKHLAQKKFEAIHGHDKFMEVFGRNYLEEYEWR